ncbi:MAG: hypothetical protein WB239_17190 [Acidimicrobiia bacterium]
MKLFKWIGAFALLMSVAVPSVAAPSGASVTNIDSSTSVDCGGTILDGQAQGWLYFHESASAESRWDAAHFSFHLLWTFSNAAGETWSFIDSGTATARTVGGERVEAVSGRSKTAPPDESSINYGRWVINRGTESDPLYDPLKVVGNQLGYFDQAVCDALGG